jgi:hypothetical protein
MNARKDDFSWIGWIVAAAIGIVFVMYLFSSSNNGGGTGTPSEPTPTTQTDTTTESSAEDSNSWHCVDATSYDHNAYNDNKCTKGSETQYVSDSPALQLDSSYSPGKAGAAYYNNQ